MLWAAQASCCSGWNSEKMCSLTHLCVCVVVAPPQAEHLINPRCPKAATFDRMKKIPPTVGEISSTLLPLCAHSRFQ